MAIQLCDILTYLHSQNPPVIHRDIKPSNIIMDGIQVRLIDFGISRRWNKDAHSDTVYLGTRSFAPPEQFGYAQTDIRADIFSFGVLLNYMFTGKTVLEKDNIGDTRLWRIIKKCAAFSPDERYADITVVKRALRDLTGVRRHRGKIFSAVAAVLLIIAGIFIWHWYQGPSPTYEDFLSQEYITLSLDSQAQPMTRAEATKIVVETLGIYDPAAESSFSDVPTDHPYYRYISSAAQAVDRHTADGRNYRLLFSDFNSLATN